MPYIQTDYYNEPEWVDTEESILEDERERTKSTILLSDRRIQELFNDGDFEGDTITAMMIFADKYEPEYFKELVHVTFCEVYPQRAELITEAYYKL